MPELFVSIPNPTVLIRKYDNLLEISQPGRSQIEDGLLPIFDSILTYTYKKKLYGYDRIINGKDFYTEQRYMYKIDELGRLICCKGMLQTILNTLKRSNIRYDVLDTSQDRSHIYEPDWAKVVEAIKLRSKQDECLINIASNDCGIIEAPTGFGKGIIIAAICLLFPKATIHVVVPGRDLVRSTFQTLSKFIHEVGQVGAGKNFIGSRVTVYSADSLHKSEGLADILIADEVHEFASPSYYEPLSRYRYSKNFGFSASPRGRQDGTDAELENLFGPIIFSLPYEDACSLGLVVPIVVQWLDIKLNYNPTLGCNSDVTKKRRGLWRNEERNKIIANKANSYSDDTQVLIMVETIEHAFNLRQFLPNFTLVYSDNTLNDETLNKYKKLKLATEDEVIVTPKLREQYRTQFEKGELKKVIATDVWATGVNFVNLQVLIRGDARSSDIKSIQIPGRVTRIGKKKFGVLVDCLDQFDSTFNRKALTRKKSYLSRGWLQTFDRDNHDDNSGIC